jgi:opacity protein-like surface antigen
MHPSIRPVSQSLGLLLGLVLPVLTAQAGGAFYLRGGSVHLNDDTQTIDGQSRDLDAWSHSTYSVSVEARRRSGLAFGFEYLSYRQDFSPPQTAKGEVRARLAQFIIKKYFGEHDIHPFLGLGIGGGNAEWEYTSGGFTNSDTTFSLALQLNAGVEFRVENVGFLLEAKQLMHDIESTGGDYNATGTGLFAGFGFTW